MGNQQIFAGIMIIKNPENNINDCYCEGQIESYNGGVFVEGIGIPWKSGIDFEFSYDNKDMATKIKLYLLR